MVNRMSYPACNRCTARKADGVRCTRNTCKYGPRCWQHTRIRTGFSVNQSGTPSQGMGLFAHRALPEGTEIPYRGKTLPELQYRQKFPGDWRMDYAVTGQDGIVRDAAKTNAGVARYANDVRVFSRGGRVVRKRQPNAGLYTVDANGRGDRVVLELTKPVAQGREVLLDYGDGYWENDAAPVETVQRHRRWILGLE